MASNAEIASRALLAIGDKTITSLDPPDDTERARVAASYFTSARDATLRAHPWKFAIKRKSIAADTDAPVYGKLRYFTLPNDCLRPLEVNGQARSAQYDWEVEGQAIITDLASPLEIKYIRRVEDPEQWDSMFTEAMVHYLASEMAPRLTEDPAKQRDQMALFDLKVSAAKSADGMERTEIDTDATDDDSWLTARGFGRGTWGAT